MDPNVNKDIQKIIAKKSILLVIVVLGIALISGVSLFGKFSSQMANYQNLIKQKLEKIDVIASYEASKEKVDKFKSSLAKPLTQDSLFNKLADFANQNNISIINLSPGQQTDHEDYGSTSFLMTIKAANFKDLVSFFYSIESSPYAMKVQSWSTKLDNSTDFINCDIDIVAVQIK